MTAALGELAALSAALGRDPEQVQAAGGNTSIKLDGVLWVKASGLWLADAERRSIFVPVRLARVLEAIGSGDPDPVRAAVVAELNPDGLRPSIETTLHALLPQAVIIHTHSVRTIALAIRPEAEALLAERLAGLAWTFLPYCQPGLPLTRALAAKLRDRPVEVVVLGNHGLVVGGETVAAAAGLLAEVERRLEAPVRPAPAADPGALALLTPELGLRPVRHARAHGVALDPERLAWAGAGSLYPDHVIFLGPALAVLPERRPGARLFAVPGKGLLLPFDAGESADELALCLALVLERVPSGARLCCLTAAEEAALLDWDAEKYRQSLAGARAAG